MDVLSRDELRALAAEQQGPCVSIFLATHKTNREDQQDQIRFKNLLRQAEDKLVAFGTRAADARDLLEPAQRLLQDGLFWQRPTGGLAVFAAPTQFRFYRLPFGGSELAVVGERFHVKRLLRMLGEDGHFYVLALTLKRQRLHRGSRYGLEEVDVPRLPAPIFEALGLDVPQADEAHGHGTADEGSLNRIRQYFRLVDQAVHEILRDERAPLVLAAVEYLHPLYRDVNTYPHLVDKGLAGSPEGLAEAEIHAQAWSIVEPIFGAAQRQAAELFSRFAGNGAGKASSDIAEILPAAHFARVDSLFVATGIQAWGRFDPDTGAVELHESPQPGDQDLLDLAAAQSLLNGARVYAVPPDDVPGRTKIAATFRF